MKKVELCNRMMDWGIEPDLSLCDPEKGVNGCQLYNEALGQAKKGGRNTFDPEKRTNNGPIFPVEVWEKYVKRIVRIASDDQCPVSAQLPAALDLITREKIKRGHIVEEVSITVGRAYFPRLGEENDIPEVITHLWNEGSSAPNQFRVLKIQEIELDDGGKVVGGSLGNLPGTGAVHEVGDDLGVIDQGVLRAMVDERKFEGQPHFDNQRLLTQFERNHGRTRSRFRPVTEEEFDKYLGEALNGSEL